MASSTGSLIQSLTPRPTQAYSLLPTPQTSNTAFQLELEQKLQRLMLTETAAPSIQNRVSLPADNTDPELVDRMEVDDDSSLQFLVATKSSLIEEKNSEKDAIDNVPHHVSPEKQAPGAPTKKYTVKTSFNPKLNQTVKRRFEEIRNEDGSPQKRARRSLEIPEATTETTATLNNADILIGNKSADSQDEISPFYF